MARKLENDELLEEEANGSTHAAKSEKPDTGSSDTIKLGKRKVVVVNVPKKKKMLRTPSHIIRISLIWCFMIVLFLLTYPFLQVTFYITDDLEVTPYAEKAHHILATQEEIDKSEADLQKALDGLVEAPKEESSDPYSDTRIKLFPDEVGEGTSTSGAASDMSDAANASDISKASGVSEVSQVKKEGGGIREMETVNYNWSYVVAENVNADKLEKLIDDVKKVDRYLYTEESIQVLNDAVLKAQRTLCASVFVAQNGLQMMLGGSIGEAFGSSLSVGNIVLRSIFAFALGVLPMIAVFACVLDKKRIVKHIIVLACIILVLLDIFFTIYPFIGIGAVLSIVMYIIIFVLNIGGIYARQQEKYIISHPELEAEFTEKHPHFVKALINEKSFGNADVPDRKTRELEAARNAKKRNSKKKKK